MLKKKFQSDDNKHSINWEAVSFNFIFFYIIAFYNESAQ